VARESFAEEKHFAVAELCDLLGATKVEIEYIEIETDKGTDQIKVSGSHPAGLEAKAELNKDVASQLEGLFDLEDTYKPHNADISSAMELLRQKRLLGDTKLVSLVNSRRRGNLEHKGL
jgi:hypothetical protein